MTPRFSILLPALLLCGALAACNGDPNANGPCTGYVAGDLVVSEFMNDAGGADTGKEWVEIFNATSKPIELRGFTLYFARPDGSNPKQHILASGTINPKAYFVLGDAPADAKPPYVHYSYGDALGGLGNTDGLIGLKCGATVVDEAKWMTGFAGSHTHQLDGALVPDSAANDYESKWCEASGEFVPGEFGSPGLRNTPCNLPGGCFDASGNSRPAKKPLPGELIITELMPNPKAVDDTAGEWIELYAAADIDLNYLTISNGSSKTVLSPGGDCLPVAAASYVLLAKSADAAVNGGLPAPMATFTFSMGNSSGTLLIKDGETVVDQMSYPKSFDGAATQLDPDKLDAADNDNFANYCPSTQVYGAGDFGTPGAVNLACPIVVPAGSCLESDGVTVRAIVTPTEGQLVISEVMADPSAVADDVGEWIEVTVAADVDLNGIELSAGTSKAVLGGGSECQPLTAGSTLVLAHSADGAINGGLSPVAATFGFALANGGGTLALKSGTTLVDQAAYPSATSGTSSQLDAGKLSATQNDQPTAFCPSVASATYGLGDRGTPGQQNAECPLVVPAGSCQEKGTTNVRTLVKPAPGQLVISEVMADPSKVSDAVGEWIELYATADVDLNGLEITNGASRTTLGGNECLRVASGTYAVIGRTPDLAVNGQLAGVVATFAYGLVNGGGTLTVKDGAAVIDLATYPTATSGSSSQLDSAKLNAADNDTASSFCPAAAAASYGLGDKGTPGAANAACPLVVPPGSCLDTSNNQVRTLVPPAAGDLVITEIMPDPSKVSDTAGEWIEVLVKTDTDLNGLELSTDGGAKSLLTTTNCVRPGANAHVVFARGTDAVANGGLTNVAGTFSFSLGNSGAHSVTVGLNNTALDTANYSGLPSGTTSTMGISWQLNANTTDAAANDVATNFCGTAAGTLYNGQDRGSPGLGNAACP